ncbi:AAA family ATPase [Candidatus Solincola sp.]|nr:AAA family ATPase [Actinomycetota bacterium]MDI7252489.1 AAA family ATPase [Actinomycetota bacterium]
MEIISVALALPSGDVTGLAEMVDGHPLLEACGVARTPEDLGRLLRRFRPDILLISTQMLLELDEEGAGLSYSDRSGFIPTLLVQGGEPPGGNAGLPQLFRGPFAFCGIVDPARTDVEGLYLQIRERAELIRGMAPRGITGETGKRLPAPGLVILAGGKGGVGNTLLSTTLAACYAEREKRVLLVDLDRERSQLSMFKPDGTGKNLVDLLPMAEDISWEMARVSMYRHPAGFHLLPFGHPRRKAGERTFRIPASFFRNLNFLFDTVVVDLPGHLAEELLPSLLPCRALAVVTLADAMSARSARVLARSIRGFGMDPRALRLILNRHGGNSALQPHEIARAVGIESTFTVPDDPRSGLDFAELGRLPRPDSPLGRAAVRLTAFLDGDKEPLPPKNPRRLLPGLGKKRAPGFPFPAGR